MASAAAGSGGPSETRAPLPLSLPRTFFNKNIFMLNGHGQQVLDNPYVYLKEHQNALIPGVCGSKLIVKDDLYSKFFRKSLAPIEIFTEYRNDKIISKKFNFNYTIELPVANGGTHQITDIQSLKSYNRIIPLPLLQINPIVSYNYKKTVDGIEYFLLHFQPSGILRQTEPTEMEVHDEWLHPLAKAVSNKYNIILEYNPNDLKLQLKDIESMGPDSTAYRVLYTIKDSLKDSVLTYEDIVALIILYKYGTVEGHPYSKVVYTDIFKEWSKIKDSDFFREKYIELILSDLVRDDFMIHLNFYFDFLDSVTRRGNSVEPEPYLLISMTCRHVVMPRIPDTPTKKNQVAEEIAKKGEKVLEIRRLSQPNLFGRLGDKAFLERLGSGGSTPSIDLLNSPVPPAAAAGAGGGPPGRWEDYIAGKKFENKNKNKNKQIITGPPTGLLGAVGLPSSVPNMGIQRVGLPSLGLSAVASKGVGLAAVAERMKTTGLGGGRRRSYRRRRRVTRRLRRTRRRLRR